MLEEEGLKTRVCPRDLPAGSDTSRCGRIWHPQPANCFGRLRLLRVPKSRDGDTVEDKHAWHPLFIRRKLDGVGPLSAPGTQPLGSQYGRNHQVVTRCHRGPLKAWSTWKNDSVSPARHFRRKPSFSTGPLKHSLTLDPPSTDGVTVISLLIAPISFFSPPSIMASCIVYATYVSRSIGDGYR